MTAALALLFCLAADPTAAVSTDDLDAYAAQVVKARNACGPTAVWYCLRRLGHGATLADVWRQADIGPDGTSLQALVDLLQAHGVRARAVVGDPQRLDALPPLSILVIDATHCVVFDGLTDDGQQVRFFEPATGELRTAARDTLQAQWTGQAILFEPPLLSPTVFAAVVTLAALAVPVVAAAGRGVWRRAVLRRG